MAISHTGSTSFRRGRRQINSVVCVLVPKGRERYAKEFIFQLIGNSTSDLGDGVRWIPHGEADQTAQA